MLRYFNSTLQNARAPINFFDYLMGHTLDAEHDAYYRASPNDLSEQYMQYINYLTISKYAVVAETDEYKRIKEQNGELERELYTQR